MNKSAHKITRKLLRKILVFETRLTLKKHKPTVVVIVGDDNPSLVREVIYSVLSTKYQVRRNLERTDSEFSVPLTVFGTFRYPKSNFEWIKIIIKTAAQNLYLKQHKHTLVIQLHYINEDIFNTWIKTINPKCVVSAGKSKNIIYDYKNVDFTTKDINLIKEGSDSPNLDKLSKLLDINKSEIKKTIINTSSPTTRISIIPAKEESLIIDARHYYYPTTFKSVTELVDNLPGKKFLYTTINTDIEQASDDYMIVEKGTNIKPKHGSVYIFRGDKDSFIREMRDLSQNDLEI